MKLIKNKLVFNQSSSVAMTAPSFTRSPLVGGGA